MAARRTALVSGEVYHVFNQSVGREQIFVKERECKRAVLSLWYHQIAETSMKLSHYLSLGQFRRFQLRKQLTKQEKLVEVLAYCLMPNHYHLLVRQVVKGGISKYMGDFQNSYSKYFNTRNERKGSLFLRPFRAVRVESDEGLLHLSRYIHLNPVTGYLVRDIDNLAAYKWSSWTEYTNKKLNLCNPSEVLSFFGGSSAKYKRFVINQADYQRKLKKIEYLIKDHQ